MQEITFTQEMLHNFLDQLLTDEKSNATLEKYTRDLLCFYRFLAPNFSADKQRIISYKKYLIDHYAPASVNSMLASVNGLLHFCGHDEYTVRNLRIQKPIFNNEQKELTLNEYNQLLSCARDKKRNRIYFIIQTIGSTGIRISELQFITVEALKIRRVQIHCKGKIRTILLPKPLCQILINYAQHQKILSGPVFCTRNKKPVNRSNVWAELKKLCRDAKVAAEKVFPHNLRHLFARRYYHKQKDIMKLADLLGHSNINTTRLYILSSGSEHERQILDLGLLFPT